MQITKSAALSDPVDHILKFTRPVGRLVFPCILILVTCCCDRDQHSSTPSDQSANGQAVAPDDQWMAGGILHNANAGEWLAATESNRLATAADFIAASMKDCGRPYTAETISRLRPDAEWLSRSITTAASGALPTEEVAFISGLIVATAEKEQVGPFASQ